jgi:hypothetical protein
MWLLLNFVQSILVSSFPVDQLKHRRRIMNMSRNKLYINLLYSLSTYVLYIFQRYVQERKFCSDNNIWPILLSDLNKLYGLPPPPPLIRMSVYVWTTMRPGHYFCPCNRFMNVDKQQLFLYKYEYIFL